MAELRFLSGRREYASVFERAGPAVLDGVVFGPDQARIIPSVAPVALVEGASENLFLNSSAPAAQVVTGTGPHTVSTHGLGRVVIGNVGVAMQGRPVTVTLSGPATVTPEGNLDWVQVEPGEIATSHIPTGGTPVSRAAESWQVEVPVRSLLNVAGVVQPGRVAYQAWLSAAGLSVGQEGRAVRVTVDGESVLVPVPLGWAAVTLTGVESTRVIVNGSLVATLPSALDPPAPTTVSGDTFVSFGSYPLRVPHVHLSGDEWAHAAWLNSLRSLGVHPRPLNVMDLDMSRGTFYHAVW